jgi:2-methylcitrate dehydratase PrpD
MTSTDEILAVAAAAAGPQTASTGDADGAVEVTEADLAAFRAVAARGAGSDVVRALRAVRPGPGPARPPGDAAWTAWVTAAAATAAATETGESARGTGSAGNPGAPVHLAWLAVFAAGTALADTGLADPQADAPGAVTVPAAVAAGMTAAAITEAGLADWGGWSSGSVAGAIGASVTAGLLLGLTPPQLRAALGISATQAAGLAAAAGTPALALQAGKAAFNGVEAALLARACLTAPHEPLDGRRGLFAVFG